MYILEYLKLQLFEISSFKSVHPTSKSTYKCTYLKLQIIITGMETRFRYLFRHTHLLDFFTLKKEAILLHSFIRSINFQQWSFWALFNKHNRYSFCNGWNGGQGSELTRNFLNFMDLKFLKFSGYAPKNWKRLTGTFNLRGLVDEHKQNLLNKDLNNYRLHVSCLKEMKINQELDINLANSSLMTWL